MYGQLRQKAPKCKRFINQQEKSSTSAQWLHYHHFLNNYFHRIRFNQISSNLTIRTPDRQLLLDFFPNFYQTLDLKTRNSFDQAQTILDKFYTTPASFYQENTRRHCVGQPHSLHMGFYEQNLSNSRDRIWQLYEATNSSLLQTLKPLIQHLSSMFEIPSPPCPPQYGLFGSLFTTIVLNTGGCQWHIDPNDKLTIILYFGDFVDSPLLVGPPVNCSLQVSKGACVVLKSAKLYHKAVCKEQNSIRFSISFYSKKTSQVTTKGILKIAPSARWATSK